jgi:hypothetical protein
MTNESNGKDEVSGGIRKRQTAETAICRKYET